MVDRLHGLRHDPIVRGHDQDHHVGDLGPARAHRRKRLVTRRVQEHDVPLGRADPIGADVLGDAARFFFRHARFANGVQ